MPYPVVCARTFQSARCELGKQGNCTTPKIQIPKFYTSMDLPVVRSCARHVRAARQQRRDVAAGAASVAGCDDTNRCCCAVVARAFPQRRRPAEMQPCACAAPRRRARARARAPSPPPRVLRRTPLAPADPTRAPRPRAPGTRKRRQTARTALRCRPRAPERASTRRKGHRFQTNAVERALRCTSMYRTLPGVSTVTRMWLGWLFFLWLKDT